MAVNGDLKEDILKAIAKHSDGLTINDISKSIRANRQTVSKYVLALIAGGQVEQVEVGRAKLCFLRKRG